MQKRIEEIENRFDLIESQLKDPEISADYSKIQKLLKEHSSIKEKVDLVRMVRELENKITDTNSMLKSSSNEEELTIMIQDELKKLKLDKLKLDNKLSNLMVPKDPNDNKNAIMEIRAGTGGEEAGLFASNLFRMYIRYAQRKGWQTEIINLNETGVGGVKEVVFQINGEEVFRYLKHESGIHRVQRVPLTESSGRIHTSASTVAVLPEAAEIDIEIKNDDIQIDIFHASGHGGQNVQKVATAVRITHKPTGIVSICQDERSQFKNKTKAMGVLRSRILALETQKHQDEISKNRKSQVGSGDRSGRVRTYNFPQNRVTDHRISLTTHNLTEILDGDIQEFIDKLLELEQMRKNQEQIS
ncbi:MAG: peptide chain release factor 1 [Chloroflexi bacterium]|nr:peptide chain release factor 1 [Chloroflexota bacterium]|tara:strand:+ start:12947 stop:14020 length:1074 start_codon:yes stop_codon:yes gene_type:complete